ncbi:GtrA family protein [Jannaschia sp. R86511]|uniref:GtrA family protein n=1 Tax=Jannaschia sp. R86511 TaxID=3093853 RepID=UPI0036D2D4F9
MSGETVTRRGGPVVGRARALLGTHQVRYLLVAGTTTLFYLGAVAAGLALDLPYMLAIALAHAVTIALAFPAYRTLVFRSSRRWQADFWRFLSVWSSGMVAGFVATPLLVELAGVDPFVAQVVAIVVVAVASYLGHRFFSFRRSQP